MLLMCDIDVNLPVYDIRAPLHAAALYGNLTALKLFLQAGARPNTLDSWHRTPLQIAVERSVNWVGPGWEARQKTFQDIVQVSCTACLHASRRPGDRHMDGLIEVLRCLH
jgi:hypothetical protein